MKTTLYKEIRYFSVRGMYSKFADILGRIFTPVHIEHVVGYFNEE